MLDNTIPPIGAGMRSANARLITAALRDTRDVWARWILPNDRSRIITLLAKVQVIVKDDEVQKNLAAFADRLSAEEGNAK